MLSLILATLFAFSGHQDKVKQPPLIAAIQKGDLAAAKVLLKAGANPNTRQLLTSKPSASERIQRGMTSPGATALDVAAERESLPFVKLLLDYKADPNARGPYEWTPLMTACSRNNVGVVRLLLQRGAKPNLINATGDTAIIFAANVDRVKMVELLLAAGADVNGGRGDTALGMAAQSGAQETVKLLLKKRANPNFHRPGYRAPLECAQTQYNDQIVAMLRRAGAKGRSAAQLEKERAAQTAVFDKEWAAKRKADAIKNAQYSKLIPADHDVIEAALTDMAVYDGKDFELSYFSKQKLMVLIDRTAVATEFTENQMNSELDERRANDIDPAMRRDLLRRNSSELPLAGLKLSTERIKMAKQAFGITGLDSSKSRGWAEICLPGYSADGNRAVLRFWFGPTPHGAAGTYLLAKKDGKWTVLWRDFAHYA